MFRKKKVSNAENGAVVIEATLSLSVFMFLIVILLSIVNICTAQAKIEIALNQTAEEMSQYLYFYSLSGLNDIQAKVYADSSETRQQIEGLEDGITDGIKSLQKFGRGGSELSDTISEIKEDGSNVKDIVQEIASTDDKTAWIKSLVKVAGNEGFEIGKGYFAGALSKGLMVKHLTINDEIDCDRNLRDMGVIDGLDGLNLNSSSIYTNGTEDITLICKYKVKLLNLLNNDITFSFVQTAKTKAWGAQALVSSDKEDDSNAVEGDKVTLVGAGEGEKFGEYAAKAKPVDGYVDVIIHASSDGKMQIYANGAWVDINSKNFEKIMKNRGLEGKNIRLVSCGAGAVDSGIANSVADRLNVNVLAPTDTVWAYPDGTLTVGPTADSNTGEWVVVSPNSSPKNPNK